MTTESLKIIYVGEMQKILATHPHIREHLEAMYAAGRFTIRKKGKGYALCSYDRKEMRIIEVLRVEPTIENMIPFIKLIAN